MKGRLYKISALFLASALFAGAIILCAFSRRLPQETFVGGTDVGGLTCAQAVTAVRRGIEDGLKSRSLKVHSGGDIYVFTYPEIGYKDDVPDVVRGISKAGRYEINVRYYLNGLDGIVSGICRGKTQKLMEPCAIFNPAEGEAFAYESGRCGIYCDGARLRCDILKSLEGGFEDVYLHTREFSPSGTLGDIMQSTALLSAFTTYYDQSNVPRSKNISLACKRISGSVLAPHGVFSFNSSVGPRTRERGFESAKVIAGGKYVYGIGGGVCQVSTTLYNAAVLAGLKITEYHPHSLPVSYVSPSRDAMVSGAYCDLKFKNLSSYPVYIRILSGSGCLRCEIYGRSDGKSYSLNSELLESGGGVVKSRLLITCEKDGASFTEVLRSDSYISDGSLGGTQ